MGRTARVVSGVVGGWVLLAGALAVRAADAPRAEPAADGFVALAPDVGGGVSGLVVLAVEGGALDVLAVHDGKGPNAPRLTRVRLDASGAIVARTPIPWPDPEAAPVDLEAAAPVPGSPGHVFLVTSGGGLYHVVVKEASVEVVARVSLRRGHLDLEAFTVARSGARYLVAYADRGAGPTSATLWVGTWDPATGFVRVEAAGRVAVPFPDPTSAATRHVSDLFLDDAGVLYGTAAHDPGDDGPFEGALYALGVVTDDGTAVAFRPSAALTPLMRFARKPEAVVLVPGADGGVLVGTDDERLGGWLRRR